MADVFVSYSRRDGVFVRELHALLTDAGRNVWVDWEDIPPASEWEQDIYDSIDAAESVVFVVSPSSLESEYCGAELRRAGEGGKRVVPIAIDGAEPAAAPLALRQLNWIWARESDDRTAAFAALERALDTDLEWSRAHTRLLVRAVEWDARKDTSLLLRGRDLEQAERELAANAGKDPRPTELQQRYLHESRRSTSRRQRLLLGGVTAALVVSVALGVAAVLQRNTANERARVAESKTLAVQALDALATTPRTSLVRAVDAVRTSDTPEARVALRRAILANPIVWTTKDVREPGRSYVGASPALAFTGDGSRVLSLDAAGAVHVRDAANGRDRSHPPRAERVAVGPHGRLLSARGRVLRLTGAGAAATSRIRAGEHVVGLGFAGTTPLALVAGHGAAAVLDLDTGARRRLRIRRLSTDDALFSRDGARVLTSYKAGASTRVRVWDARTGALLATLPKAHEAVLSPDGRHVATLGVTNAELWAVAGARRVADLGENAYHVVFSPDGRLALAVGSAGDATIWRARDGRPVGALPGFGSEDAGAFTQFDRGAAFSADGRLVALANLDGNVRVWDVATRKQVGMVGAGWADRLAFAPYGGLLAVLTWNGDLVVARTPASIPLGPGFVGGFCEPLEPTFSPDGSLVAAPVAVGAGLWRSDGRPVQVLRPPATGERTVGALAFGADGKTVAAGATAIGCGLGDGYGVRFGTAVWQVGRSAPLQRVWAEGEVALGHRGTFVVTGERAWRTASGSRIRALDGTLALSPGGGLALVVRRRTARVVDAPSGRTVAQLDDGGELARSVGESELTAALAAGGGRVLTSVDDSLVSVLRLWDARTGAHVARLDRKGEVVESYRFSRDGRLVLVLFGEHAATYDAATGKRLASVVGHFDALSDDGAFAAAGQGDGTVRLVDMRTGLSVAVQTDTATQLGPIAFGPTSALLAAVDDEGDVHVLRCAICASDAELLKRAESTLDLVSQIRRLSPPVGRIVS